MLDRPDRISDITRNRHAPGWVSVPGDHRSNDRGDPQPAVLATEKVMYNWRNPERNPPFRCCRGTWRVTESITQAVEQIRSTVLTRSLDESATKQSVVLRMLGLCGWDLFDLSQVAPEYTVGSRRVDYALMPGTANAVFIEAKRLGENLVNHQQQLLEYCFQEGVRLAVLTNGQNWWLYLPLQPGSWEERRFLTIDLASQEPAAVERRLTEYLSQENVSDGRAVSNAEDLVQLRQLAGIANRTIVEAWNQIVATPDDLLVDLVSEVTMRICGIAPEREMVEQFLSRQVQAMSAVADENSLPVSSGTKAVPPASGSRVEGRGVTLPITLDPPNSQDFLEALLLTREAWIEELYANGRREVHHWDASRMSQSSGVINNLRSRPRYRQGNWQKIGIASLRVSVERPGSERA